MTYSWEKALAPKKGDLANHLNGLDGRIVTRVEHRSIWLDILGKERGPFPLQNYRFQRMINPCPECAQGKHGNCTEEVLFEDIVEKWVPCPCHKKDHP